MVRVATRPAAMCISLQSARCVELFTCIEFAVTDQSRFRVVNVRAMVTQFCMINSKLPTLAASDDNPFLNATAPVAEAMKLELLPSYNELPPWIQPPSVQDGIRVAVVNAMKILDMSESELASMPIGANEDVSIPLQLTKFGFQGITATTGLAFDTFLTSFTFLESVYPDPQPVAARCGSVFVFWFQRPAWYVPAIRDLREIRTCVTHGMKLLVLMGMSKTETDIVSQTSIVAVGLSALLPVIYAPRVELRLRNEFRTAADGVDNLPTRLGNFTLFLEFIHQRPKLLDLLLHASKDTEGSIAELLPTLPRDDLAFVEHLIGVEMKDPSSVHLGDFIDYYWSASAVRNNGMATLPLWRSLVVDRDGWDMEDFEYETQKPVVMNSVEVDYKNRLAQYRVLMGAGMATWVRTVGVFLQRLSSHSNEGLRACLPPAFFSSQDLVYESVDLGTAETVRLLFYFFTANVRTVPPFYRCVADGVHEFKIFIVEDGFQLEAVATLMHLVRMGTSPSAFLLSVTE